MSTEVLVSARTTPPDLNDPSQYTRIERVPVLTTHLRKRINQENGEVKITRVDGKQLRVLCDNTNKRVRNKEYPLVLIGHTDPKLPETSQPPRVGYLGQHVVGEYNGEPAILADMYIDNGNEEVLSQYPRRSPEVFKKEDPSGYIDSVSLLVRAPELDLGYITRHSKSEDMEIFECSCEKEKLEMEDPENKGVEEGENLAKDEETPTKPPEPDANKPDLSTDEPEDVDGDGDVDSVDKLSKVLAQHVSDLMKNDPEFHSSLGEHLASALANSKEFLDALMSRMGDILDGSKGSQEEKPETSEEPEKHAAGTPSGTATATPKANDMEKFSKDVDPNIQIGILATRLEASEAENKKLNSRLEELERFSKETVKENAEIKRKNRLQSIADKGISIDVDEKLEKFSKFSDEDFEMFAKDIEDNYPRIPLNESAIPIGNDNRTPTPFRGTLPDPNKLTESEIKDGAIERFAKSIGFTPSSPTDGVTLVKRYFNEADRSKYLKK